MKRFGLDYETLRQKEPDLFMISVSGWGPSRIGIAYLDPISGMVGAGAILTALHHWKSTGAGHNCRPAWPMRNAQLNG